MTPDRLTPQRTIRDLEASDQVGGPSQLLYWIPKKPFSMKGTGMPWEPWSVDRFLAWVPEDALEQLEGGTEKAAANVLQELNTYSFDGEMAFIPGAHAERFWVFLAAYFQAAAEGHPEVVFEDQHIPVEQDVLLLGDTVTGVFGMRTPTGLWLVFAESDCSFDTDFLSRVIAAYPDAQALAHVRADAMLAEPGEELQFDPTRAWTAMDSHLGDHLYPSRAQANGPANFHAFLAGAIADGALWLNAVVQDMADLPDFTPPAKGQPVFVVGLDKHHPKVLATLAGGKLASKLEDATAVLLTPGSSAPDNLPDGVRVWTQAQLVDAVLAAHGRPQPPPPKREYPRR